MDADVEALLSRFAAHSEALETIEIDDLRVSKPAGGAMYYVEVVGQDANVTRTVRNRCLGMQKPYNNVFRVRRFEDGYLVGGLRYKP